MTALDENVGKKAEPHVLAVACCDFVRSGIGTRSRAGDLLAGKTVIAHVLEKLLAVESITAITLLVPHDQLPQARGLQSLGPEKIHVRELQRRPEHMDRRIAIGRAWNLHAWRGGAGQWTVFDEEYHPAAIAKAAHEFNADHVLIIPSHAALLDVDLTAKLIHHHLHKNHEMRMTYTASAPGLTGMVLQADLVREMAEKNALPWQLLAYDPAAPSFDTLIRDACMQVDPALSKIPNRFCVDTERSFQLARELLENESGNRGIGESERTFNRTLADSPICPLAGSSSTLALAAARSIAPGVRDFSRVSPFPRELEIELTGKRLTNPPGSVPQLVREARGELSAAAWQKWIHAHRPQQFPDDLLITLAGDGDPLLHPDLPLILAALRAARPLSICVQTDLLSNCQALFAAIEENLVDVVSIPMYGHTRETYAALAQCSPDFYDQLLKNLTDLAQLSAASAGAPLVIPRLLKVRQTIPEIEPFFDAWIQQTGWAVIDGPTDRAGSIPFAAVVDMGPMKRKPCRRIWDRIVLRANGNAVACTEDMMDHLTLGNIETHSLTQMWTSDAMTALRKKHAEGNWGSIVPCATCREWYRP